MSYNKAAKRFFAQVLMAVGGLITVLCGGCTVFWLGSAIWSVLVPVIHHGYLSPADRYVTSYSGVIAVGALVIGGLPTAVGVGLFVVGRRMAKGADASLGRDVDRPLSLEE
jgi:hypothetical protein